jgi:hypothetical protein
MLATGARRRRLGDLAARTGIARAVPIRHRDVVGAVVASVLVLVLVLAGSVVYVAASDEDEGSKTYRGHGVSFDYPAGWEEGKTQTLGSSDSTNKRWKAAVTAGDLDLASATAYRLNISVTAQNVDSVMPELVSLVQQVAEQQGGAVQGGPEQLTVAGLPGARFQITGTTQGAAIPEHGGLRVRRHDRVRHQLPTHGGEGRRDRTGLRTNRAHIQGGLAARAPGFMRTPAAANIDAAGSLRQTEAADQVEAP